MVQRLQRTAGAAALSGARPTGAGLVLNSTTLYVVLVVFAATLIRSTFGFGEALIAVPLLALRIPVAIAAPLAVLMSVVIAGVIVVLEWRQIDFRSAGGLVAASLFGIPLGVWLLASIDDAIVKLVLGVVIVVFSMYSLAVERARRQVDEHPAWLLGCGFLSGILGGAYGMNGPPLVAYGALRRWSPQQFRATLQGYFLPASLAGLLGYWFIGLWNDDVTRYALWSLPGAGIAILLGGLLNNRMQSHRFFRFVYGFLLLIGSALLLQSCGGPSAPVAGPQIQWGLVLHGGAGTIDRARLTPAVEAEYRAALTTALQAGHRVLRDGGSSLDAVVAAITVLEDSPLFNAGRGAVFTADGTNSLDAAIMDGATLRAGAVAGVTDVKNPIALARLVMEKSPHVLLSGAGAEQFARQQGIPSTSKEWFYTERRWQELQDAKAAEAGSGAALGGPQEHFGTVGVVALDRSGKLAAGTSTGGMTNKKWGRIGDSPIVGAGTYADARCGVSGTGWGEFYIRNVVAHDICARVEYAGVSIAQAAADVVKVKLPQQEKDTGGVIAMDRDGRIAMPFNTSGMYRGWIGVEGKATTAIFAE